MSPTIRHALWCAALMAGIGLAAPASATDKAPAKDAGKPAAGQPSQQEMMAAMMKMAAPGPEHAALNPLAGSWKTVTKMWNSPSGEPVTSEGTCERSWIMGGRYLVANYKGDFAGMAFEGMEVLGYDNMKKQYVSSWVDNMGTGIMMTQGPSMDPATHSYTLSGTMIGPSGQETTAREVTNIVDGNTYTMTMFASDHGQEQKMMEITYSRKK
ncbi:MAG TPA: DUF1579 domain-containing protein [Candidatus Eisenbacteria bacterium]|nr:DUF1579 domain-containing protein [Candidatus Eisenbacteria bacterium]